ncbi:HD domain-containing protein [Patescibacteria group bacterium]
MKINILSITSKDLIKGVYKKNLPEYYELEEIVENNPWHLNQNVLKHSIAVFKGLEKVFKLDFAKKSTKTKLKKYLQEKIGKHTRKELLIIATLFHDIAKTKTFTKDSAGNTKCIAHEIVGSLMVSNFSNRFDLDKVGEKYVEKMVLFHGFTNDILSLIIEKSDELTYFNYFKKAADDVCKELLLLMYADILGSDVKKAMPQVYKERLELITKLLNM